MAKKFYLGQNLDYKHLPALTLFVGVFFFGGFLCLFVGFVLFFLVKFRYPFPLHSFTQF